MDEKQVFSWHTMSQSPVFWKVHALLRTNFAATLPSLLVHASPRVGNLRAEFDPKWTSLWKIWVPQLGWLFPIYIYIYVKNNWRKFDPILLLFPPPSTLRPATEKRGNPAPGSGRFTLNQIYSLIFEVPKGVMPQDFDAAAWSSGVTREPWKMGAFGCTLWLCLMVNH